MWLPDYIPGQQDPHEKDSTQKEGICCQEEQILSFSIDPFQKGDKTILTAESVCIPFNSLDLENYMYDDHFKLGLMHN